MVTQERNCQQIPCPLSPPGIIKDQQIMARRSYSSHVKAYGEKDIAPKSHFKAFKKRITFIHLIKLSQNICASQLNFLFLISFLAPFIFPSLIIPCLWTWQAQRVSIVVPEEMFKNLFSVLIWGACQPSVIVLGDRPPKNTYRSDAVTNQKPAVKKQWIAPPFPTLSKQQKTYAEGATLQTSSDAALCLSRQQDSVELDLDDAAFQTKPLIATIPSLILWFLKAQARLDEHIGLPLLV